MEKPHRDKLDEIRRQIPCATAYVGQVNVDGYSWDIIVMGSEKSPSYALTRITDLDFRQTYELMPLEGKWMILKEHQHDLNSSPETREESKQKVLTRSLYAEASMDISSRLATWVGDYVEKVRRGEQQERIHPGQLYLPHIEPDNVIFLPYSRPASQKPKFPPRKVRRELIEKRATMRRVVNED